MRKQSIKLRQKKVENHDKNFSTWDLKSILSTTAVIGSVILIFSMLYIPTCDTRNKDSEYYNSETKGVVYSIERKTGMTQSRLGNRETTIEYKIYYSYEVNGRRYDNIEHIYNVNNYDNLKFIKYANKNIGNNAFIVRYDSFNPEESFIVKSID